MTLTDPYSLTQVFEITGEGGFINFSADARLKALPEPTSLTLLGIGLVGFGLMGARRSGSVPTKQ